MKRCCFFFLLLCLVAAIPSSIAVKYHGKNRFWTVVTKKDGEPEKTYFALHQYRGDPTKLIFPKETGLLPIQTYSTEKKGCTDAGKLNFRFTVKPEYYLRGEVARELNTGVVTASMYEKCVADIESSIPFTAPKMETGQSIDSDRSECFTPNTEFQELVNDHTKRTVDFEVDGTFGCSAFLILDSETMIKDEPLATAHRIPLNSSEEEEWKTAEHKFLPDGVKYDGQKNPNFDLNQMVPATPYFVRYGDNQPIPTFQFNIGTSCSVTSFDIQINENLGDECKIHVDIVDGLVKVKTKHGEKQLTSLSASISFSMVFDLEAVYIKTADPVQIERLGICKIMNAPADQLNFRVSMGTAICEDVKLLLLQADVEQGIDVLINKKKALESVTTIAPHDEAATASLEWWIWIIIGVDVLILIGAIIAVVVFLYIRRRKEKQRKLNEKKGPQKPILNGTEQEKNQKDVLKEEKEATVKRIKKDDKKKDKKKKSKSVLEKTDDESGIKMGEKKEETKDEQEINKEPPPPPATPAKAPRSKSKKRRPKPYIGEVGRVSSVEKEMPISPVIQSTQETTGTIENNKADARSNLPLTKSKPTPLSRETFATQSTQNASTSATS